MVVLNTVIVQMYKNEQINWTIMSHVVNLMKLHCYAHRERAR